MPRRTYLESGVRCYVVGLTTLYGERRYSKGAGAYREREPWTWTANPKKAYRFTKGMETDDGRWETPRQFAFAHARRFDPRARVFRRVTPRAKDPR